MGLPKEWRLNLEDLKNRSLSGKHATTSAMDELIAAGYVVRRKIKNGSLFSGYEYQVFQDVADAEAWKSVHGISVVGKPDYGKSEYGESEYGKPRTNKETGTKELIEVRIEEISNEGDAPAHFADVSKKVSKGQPVIDFIPDSLLNDENTQERITGPDATKRKPSKKSADTLIADVYTREGYITAWEWTPFAKANPHIDGGVVYDRLEAWSSSKGERKLDWLATGRVWVQRGKPDEFIRKVQSIEQQAKMARAAGHTVSIKDEAIARGMALFMKEGGNQP
jgi:hypothetical protein